MNEWQITEFGRIPLDWDLVSVDEIRGIHKRSLAMGPFGSNIKAENFVSEGVPVIRGSNMNYDRYVGGEFVFLTEEKANELEASNCKEGDIVFTHRGTIGQVAIVPNKYKRYVISQSGMKLSVNNNIANNIFIFYFFKSEYGQYQLLKHESQVGVPSISNPLTSLKAIKVPLPPLPEQQAIANVLSSLDDKIELLHRQNRTLEAMAETLFRQWFVEEAKEEWEMITIGEAIETVLGGTPSTATLEYWNGDIPWINSGEVNNFRILKGTKFITDQGLKKSNTKLLPIGTTVVAITGATLGQVSLLEIETCANQSVVGIIPNANFSKEFIYLWIKYNIEEIILNETGGAQPHINKNDINNADMIAPPKSYLEDKTSKVKPLFDKITKNSFQIIKLENIRDTLLPKLMSGEVRVELN